MTTVGLQPFLSSTGRTVKVPSGIDMDTLESDIHRDFTDITPSEIEMHYGNWVESKTEWAFLLNTMSSMMGLRPDSSALQVLDAFEKKITTEGDTAYNSSTRAMKRLEECEQEKRDMQEARLQDKMKHEEEIRKLKDEVADMTRLSATKTEEHQARIKEIMELHSKEVARLKQLIRNAKGVQELRQTKSRSTWNSTQISFGSRVDLHRTTEAPVDAVNPAKAPTLEQLRQQFPVAKSTARRVTTGARSREVCRYSARKCREFSLLSRTGDLSKTM